MPVPLPHSCVSLSGTGMHLSLQQSLVPHVQPQLPQTVFSMPGILGKRAKSRFLAPCSTCWSALHPSLSPMAVFSLPCVPSCSATGIASRWLVLEVSPCFLLPQNEQPPSSHKALDFAYGSRGLETSVIVWETGTELSILVCRETLGTPLGLVPGGAAAAPLFCTGAAGDKAGTCTNDSFLWAALLGVGEEPCQGGH